MGLFIFVGVDKYETDIFTTIKPKSKCNKFIYKCSNKFVVDFIYDYLVCYNGSVTFANGNSFFIYTHGENGFEQVKCKKVDLGTRHNKGGQSQHRHERNFDIVKDYYINLIAEETVKVNTENNWIFGSLDIISKVILKNPKLKNGGYTEVNKDTINDTNKWFRYLEDDSDSILSEDIKLSEIVKLLEVDPDRLDFDINNKDIVEYCMINSDKDISGKDNDKCENVIYLSPKHKHYEHLFKFNYIGVKYSGQWLE